MRPRHADYWERIATEWSSNRPQQLWRNYSDIVNSGLLAQWLEPGSRQRALKTDAFDEAVGTNGLFPSLAAGAKSIYGMDLSLTTLRSAGANYPGFSVANADIRRVPFADASFDFVLSPSTLDHLDGDQDIADGLVELHRVLRPGGRLLLTLDNGRNPIVAFRNWLPQRALTSVGVIPYEMGATCGPDRLRELILSAGFEQVEIGSFVHCPRAPAVAVANLLDRWAGDRTKRAFIRSLLAWERLGAWPTRFWTGYYITVAAVRA